jgi:hypothetical protein
MPEDRKQNDTRDNAGDKARTWTVTIAIAVAILIAMYGLAYLNDAHFRAIAAPAALTDTQSAPSR